MRVYVKERDRERKCVYVCPCACVSVSKVVRIRLLSEQGVIESRAKCDLRARLVCQ